MKAAGLDKIPPEVWKTRTFDDRLLQYYNVVYNQNTIERWIKAFILPFLKKGDLRMAYSYQGITLNSIVAKIYNALLLNHIEPEIEKILWKNPNDFRRNRSTTSQILTIRRSSCKKSQGDTLIYRFLKGIWIHTQRKDGENTSSLWSSQRNYHSHNDAQ